RVQVASIDGVTDEFALRSTKVEAAEPVAAAPVPRRPASAHKSAGWAPWDQPFGQTSERREPHRPTASASNRRQPKPKSIFDLLFN
ncbi:MAG: hypothetical protein ABL907_01700, partial [Hyphomicrobium sp.]